MRIAPARQGVKRVGRICGCAPLFLCGCAFARGAAGSIPSGAAARKKSKRRDGVQAERFRCADGFFISGARCKNGAGGLPRRGGWARRAGPSAGDADRLRTAGGDRPRPAANTESAGGRAAGGCRSRGGCAAEKLSIVGAQSAFLAFCRIEKDFCCPSGKGETLLLFSRRCAKRFRRSLQESVRNEPTARTVGLSGAPLLCMAISRRPSERRARIFADAKI